MTSDLIPVEAGQLGPVAEASDATRQAIRNSKSRHTLRCYAAQWKLWSVYADRVGCAALPAEPGHVSNWCTERAHRQAMTTIRTGLAAVVFMHRTAGQPFDQGAPILAHALDGLDRKDTREPKQAKALGPDILAGILAAPGVAPIDVRDRALISLCYLFGLRASELVSLDFEAIGAGRGYLVDSGDSLELHRVRSKAIKAGRAKIAAVRCTDAPKACAAIRAWLRLANIVAGEPIARRIRSGGTILADRITEQSVTLIMVRRVFEVFEAAGRSDELEAAKRFTSHATRVGVITASREKGISVDDLAAHVGQHPSTTAGYARNVQALAVSPFRKHGVGV